jgi:hypothetical protein
MNDPVLEQLLKGNLGIIMVLIVYESSKAVWRLIQRKLDSTGAAEKSNKEGDPMALSREQENTLIATYRNTKTIAESLTKTDANGRPLWIFPAEAIESLRKIVETQNELFHAVKSYSAEAAARFAALDHRLGQIEKDLDGIKIDLDSITLTPQR